VTEDDIKFCASIINILIQNNNRSAKNGARIKPRIEIEIKGMDKWSIFVVPYASNFIASNTLKH